MGFQPIADHKARYAQGAINAQARSALPLSVLVMVANQQHRGNSSIHQAPKLAGEGLLHVGWWGGIRESIAAKQHQIHRFSNGAIDTPSQSLDKIL